MPDRGAQTDILPVMSSSRHVPTPLTHGELLDVRALRDVQQPEVWDLLARCPVRELEPGEILLYGGQANDRMHFVLRGQLSVRLTGPTGDVLTLVERGGTVGELSVVDRKPATAFVVAEKPTRLLTLHADDFWKLAQASTAFSHQLIVHLTAQVRRSTTSLIKTLEANVELEERAMIDGLTRVLNRGWLADRGERLLRRATVANEPLSLLMVDVDHFKHFNDTYGHPAGDAVLVAVATTLAACVRPNDLVARYGGEEFVVVLPNTKLADARLVSERARVAVGGATVRGTDGALLSPVTVSIGVAQAEGETALASLIARADALLYAAKDNGRNRVEG